MVGRPGRQQISFASLEVDPLLVERSELKVVAQGLAWAENIEAAPQGGFRQRDGLRDVGALPADAARLFPFNASDGSSYDLTFRPGAFSAWSATTLLQTVSIAALTSGMLAALTVAQERDTMLLFHEDLRTKRVKHAGPTSWSADDAPFEHIPNYDYGGSYSNGVAAQWRIEFVGLTSGATTFSLTVSNQETISITYDSASSGAVNAANCQAAILALPNISPGLTVAVTGTSTVCIVTFSGAGNEGDGWAVSGRVHNKNDAAIVSAKITAGVKPGEPLISPERGWPACGTFTGQQRLLIGGFKSLSSAWMFSALADYFNFDERLTEADGPGLVPMQGVGGEKILHIADALNPLIFTNEAEYWLEKRSIAATEAPIHVRASTHGTKPGLAPVPNEGAMIFAHQNGSVLAEMRYTDVQGNFLTQDISLYGSHLVVDVVDMARRRATLSSDGHQLCLVLASGEARQATVLREQDIMGYGRMTSKDASFKAVAVNGRNEISWIIERPAGRRLERSEDGLLLDEAVTAVVNSKIVPVPSRLVGREIWCIADGNVFGPFTPATTLLTLPVSVETATLGTWTPPKMQTLPLPRTIGPNTVLKRKARIHSVVLSLIDTTSVAISTNGKPLKDVPLRRFGMVADVAELDMGFTGERTIRNLTGWEDEPYLTISQLRPGRLQVRSVTLEAHL